MATITGVKLIGRTKYKNPLVEVTPPAPTSDPYFANVSLLIQPSLTDTVITDKSLAASSVTNDNITLTASSLSGKAMDCRGQSVRLALTVNTDTAMDFGTDDFTVETWIYPTAVDTDTNNYIIDTVGPVAFMARNGREVFGDGSLAFGVSPHFIGSVDYPINQWVHFAVSRVSGTARLFINGVLKSTIAMPTDYQIESPLYIGVRAPFGPGFNFDDLINSVRITNGIGRYTANFTPKTEFPTE